MSSLVPDEGIGAGERLAREILVDRGVIKVGDRFVLDVADDGDVCLRLPPDASPEYFRRLVPPVDEG